ncbi:pectinesterase inhibitor 10-like isoform X1 [Thunnus albacares]|uniref:pectinesterase inhibitor 10-like isoform X1 n=1 Tax=Thunnus albacares TaxID=8236 RepID=UPI001CF668A6|nr:pectinesterase inhibitor 10-like isoform X1 [Thunnus albacares]
MPKYRSGDRCVEVDQLPSIRSSAEISGSTSYSLPDHRLCLSHLPSPDSGSCLLPSCLACSAHPPAWLPSPFPLPSLTPSPSSRFPATSPSPCPIPLSIPSAQPHAQPKLQVPSYQPRPWPEPPSYNFANKLSSNTACYLLPQCPALGFANLALTVLFTLTDNFMIVQWRFEDEFR